MPSGKTRSFTVPSAGTVAIAIGCDTTRLVAFVLCALLARPALATPISPPLQDHHLGDVTSDTLFVHYTPDANGVTGTLHVDGFPVEFDDNDQGFFSGTFSLTLSVSQATGAPLGGTIFID